MTFTRRVMHIMLKREAATSGGFNALLRGKKKNKKKTVIQPTMHEAASIVDGSSVAAVQDPADKLRYLEGPRVKVVLITEGLGNRRDMNYYGSEAIDQSPDVFEGKSCFLDHPSFSEERDIPERHVRDKVGYFKNCTVENTDGVRSLVAELHFDLSESGRLAYDKACTALHYQQEFPGSDQEYVGLSVNADGEVEERTMNVDGETVEVNYVTRFTDAMSCDIVTMPARGGKFLALVESAAGASLKTKEVRTMIVKRLQAAQTALKEAIAKAKDPDQKKRLTESMRNVEAVLKEAMDAARSAREAEGESESESESESKESKEDESEGKKKEDESESESKESETETESEDDAEDDDDDDEKDAASGDDSHTVTHKSVSTGKAAAAAAGKEDAAMESNRLAIERLVEKSGLDAEYFDVEELSRGTLKEAKVEISRVKRLSEAMAKKWAKVLDVAPAHLAKQLTESGKPHKSNNDLFASCSL